MKVILIVDDDAPVRRSLRRALMGAGVEDLLLLEAENGLEGLEMARARNPDVIVSDWNMPVLDGLELLHALRREGRTTRFVLVTSPQHDTVAEAAWFADQLTAQGFGVAATVANRVHPQFGSGTVRDAEARAAKAADPGAAALWRNLAELRRLADAERAELAHLATRTPGAPMVEVPLLATDVHDQQALDQLAARLFA